MGGWIKRLLEKRLPGTVREDVVGDLEELARRRTARWGAWAATLITGLEGLCQLAYWTIRTWGIRTPAAWLSGSEFRLALRLLVKQPVLTTTAVLALGTGVGIAAGGISLIRQGLYGELPFANGDRFVVVRTYSEESGRQVDVDLERMRSFREASSLAYIGNAETVSLNIVHDSEEVERVIGTRLTPGFFAHLPYAPMLGRLLVADDGVAGTTPVALIRESFWRRNFGADRNAVGETVNVAGEIHTVVGVLPDSAGFPNEAEVWLAHDEALMGATDDRAGVDGRIIAILSDDASVDQVQNEISERSRQISAAGRGVEGQRHLVVPMARMQMNPQAQTATAGMMAVFVAVLLTIAANVANLITARTVRRSGELAVRSALGATRGRLVGQLFAEVLVVAAIASIIGLGLADRMLRFYDGLFDELPFWVHLQLNGETAVLVGLLGLLSAGVMGLIPALRATGGVTGDKLRAGGRGGVLGIGRVGGTMIAAQVALSVGLLGAAIVFARGFESYINPNFHLPDGRVLTATVSAFDSELGLAQDGEPVEEPSQRLAAEVLSALEAMPGVGRAALANSLPRVSPWPEPLALQGRPDQVQAPVVWITPDFFGVLEVEPLLGRAFRDTDLDAEASRVAVVNEAFALEHFGTVQVLGQSVRMVDEHGSAEVSPWHEIVGVVPNIIEVAGGTGSAGAYFPFDTRRRFSVAIQVAGRPMALGGSLRRVLFDLDPNLVVTDIASLEDVGTQNRQALLGISSAMTGMGFIALLLSLAGIYSIVSLAVSQRTREIGVRVALGAEPARVLWGVLRRSGFLVLTGAIIGAIGGGAFATAQGLFVFNLPDPEIWLFPALVTVTFLASMAACWVPARRALRIQPVEALRSEG